MSMSYENEAYFEDADEDEKKRGKSNNDADDDDDDVAPAESEKNKTKGWNNSIEFLMSCVAMSVGFGNIWRFPFTAYENGGGAFLIPYIILLILVGKPFYYLEMIVGQFSGWTSIKVWHVSPGCAGIGWAQLCSTVALVTYYSCLMALNLFYLIASFASELPWSRCRDDWPKYCVDSGNSIRETVRTNETMMTRQSSAELYFMRIVLKEVENIDDGIGVPNWELVLCLLGSWLCVGLILVRGIKSTGKASYFLAIFPYVVLISLLIRAVTLDGALDGILFFVIPKWEKLLEPSVWYAAVTQCFFSLSVCFGAIITYSSHNHFNHNIHRDVLIVTSLDTLTSMMAGCTIFGILGNLAHEMGTNNISSVVQTGTGLAFVSYPDAIAKFTILPQFFAVLFFLMMFVLGVGSAVAMNGSIISTIIDQFPRLKYWQVMYPTCCIGFVVGLVYITPGGQFILTLVDYYGTSSVVFILASFEIIGFIWIYGFENFLDDVEFMLGKKASVYWRFCWFLATPLILITIFIYTVATLQPLKYRDASFPWTAHTAGMLILIFAVGQIPLWAIHALLRNRHLPFLQQWKKAFAPTSDWGPRSESDREAWLLFKEKKIKIRNLRSQPLWLQNLYVLVGIEPSSLSAQ